MASQDYLQLDIVSAEGEIFSGHAKSLVVSGSLGELGILPGHTPLLTGLKPGQVQAFLVGQEKEAFFYVSGGTLEVQPFRVTVLSDTAMRAEDLDEAAAIAAEQEARQSMENRDTEFEYSQAAAALAEAVAQIELIRKMRNKAG
jgi:F-type H+-transporting ATPase subunit epsilon